MYPEIITETYWQHFGETPVLVVRAPGRINLIGEHTDYNEGFVLPASIDKAIYFAASPRNDSDCHFFAQNLGQAFSCNLHQLQRSPLGWPDYLMGVLSEIQGLGHTLKGVNIVFGGDIPKGAGVSSSAAVEGGMACVLNTLFDLNLPKIEQVRIAQRAENRFVGVNCGIMDMFASIMGREESCIKIDCRSLAYEYIPFHAPDCTIFLCDTGVKHSLVDSEYNTRRQECEAGVAILQKEFADIRSLRDVTPAMLHQVQDKMPPVVFHRCKYVTEEIERVQRACAALEIDDLATFGTLMFQTHDGLQHEYGVSCPELDFLVEQTRAIDGVLGARMMGGGFGGCTINLVKKDAAKAFLTHLKATYVAKYGRELPCHEVALTNGVEVLKYMATTQVEERF